MIEKNIPIPPKGGGPNKYRFCDLKEIGDSTLIESDRIGSVRTAASSFAHRNGVKFATRQESESSIRIWRIA